MTASARLVATLAAPLASGDTDAPYVEHWPGKRLLVQRGDTELVVRDLDQPATESGEAVQVHFPAPWPRRFGGCAVAPTLDLVVFTGVHTLRAMDRTGAVRWEIRHRCWADMGRQPHGTHGTGTHESYDEYADSRDHRHASSGSAGFSADGTLVWAHVRGPLTEEHPERGAADPWAEEWLVIDAAQGRVLARADARATAAGSVHVPHPDPSQMGLSIGEGQDGAPLRWGRWDGRTFSVSYFGDEDRILMAVSPSGDRLLTVSHDQDILAVHRVADGSVEAELSVDVVPGHPEADANDDEVEAFWDYEGGFIDESIGITGTVESDEESGEGRHWLVDLPRIRLTDQVAYPYPVSGLPRALGNGTWYTVSETDNTLRVWRLQ
ncbi:hypothetical protein [Streptomyces europaeiscabiei]|uniref:hypothetical protein n=1 Tax=Streptomyces europaeiscabiei TaxID=146819 RepID=UPI00299F9CE7|nr:hypothetical protein [Streptomyces europaeiscabiei]MDX3784203.1 hypothetical protein [Streptomyces europaeiscabiei]